MFCTQCGKANADDAKLCAGCGAAIGAATESAAAPQARNASLNTTQNIGLKIQDLNNILNDALKFKDRATAEAARAEITRLTAEKNKLQPAATGHSSKAAISNSLLEFLRLDVICPKCGEKNMELIKELIGTNEFNCSFCENKVSISGDVETQERLSALKDFVEHAYTRK